MNSITIKRLLTTFKKCDKLADCGTCYFKGRHSWCMARLLASPRDFYLKDPIQLAELAYKNWGLYQLGLWKVSTLAQPDFGEWIKKHGLLK